MVPSSDLPQEEANALEHRGQEEKREEAKEEQEKSEERNAYPEASDGSTHFTGWNPQKVTSRPVLLVIVEISAARLRHRCNSIVADLWVPSRGIYAASPLFLNASKKTVMLPVQDG